MLQTGCKVQCMEDLIDLKKKAKLDSSLPFGQLALKFCFHWATRS